MSCNAKKDPNGTWWIQYRWMDWTGTKKKSQKRGFKTKKEAEDYLKTIHNQFSVILNYTVNFYELRSNPFRKAGSMGKAGRMKDQTGRWKNFRGFQMRLWINRILGLHFRFYSGRECVWENF